MTNVNLDKPPVKHSSRFTLRLLVPVVWAAIILWLSLTSSPPQFPGVIGWDKLQHAGAYGLLTLFLAQMLPCVFHITNGKSWTLAGLAAVSYGGLMEVLQWLAQSGRSPEWGDVVADAVGVLLCCVIFCRRGVLPLPGDESPGGKHG